MAGSRSSPPLLRDQWSAPGDTRDQRDRGRPRPRGSNRERGRDKFRDRERRRRSKANGPHPPLRSPPPSRPHPQPDFEGPRSHRDFSPNNLSARGSPGLSYSEPRQQQQQQQAHQQPSRPTDHLDSKVEVEGATERFYKRDDSPSAPPPFKRKRTQSPSPGIPPPHPYDQGHHRPPADQFDEADRGYPHKKRGRFPGRGRARRRSPRRGRDRRRKEFDHFNPPEPNPHRHPRGRFHSPNPADGLEVESRHRSTSRHSAQSVNSRVSASSRRNSNANAVMNPRPAQSAMDASFRSPSPPRPIPSFDADTASVPVDGDASNNQRSRLSRPHVDTSQYSTSPNHVALSNQGSPQSTSPFPAGRGGWTGQPPYPGPQGSRHSSPYRQNNYPSQSGSQDPYYQGQGPPTGPASHAQPYSGPSYRGGHSGYRGNYQHHGHDRRFSGSGPSPRGRGRFNSFQWSTRGRGGSHSPHTTHGQPPQSPPPPPGADMQNFTGENFTGERGEIEAFGTPRGDIHGENKGSKPGSKNGDSQQMSRPTQPSDSNSTPNKGGKFSFAFKAKTAPAPAPKPVPDLAQRMQVREPPPRATDAPPPRHRMPLGPPPRFKPEPRFDRRDRDRDRDRHRNRDRDRGRRDRREFRDPRDVREHKDGRDNRKADRRVDHRHENRKDDRWQDGRLPRRLREHSPQVKPPKILTRPKPRPTLPEEYAKSDSVYYRKPGNESVIGAGTYGKVFKAIHVYTQRKVALKKIRMEGEKDGFPVTAVREIKLLQHLRNHNVVSLLEVMVEKNECFMVFEYLSHDLTGLINHPTFTLTAAHKKDLAKQMFEGLNYLHHRSVLHRDIKAANILISNKGLLKFADFGLARFFSKSRQLDYTNRVITIWYRPPELLLGETRYGPAVDVWSAGCVFVELFTKKAVFPGEGGEISQLEKLYNSLGTPTRAEWPDIVEMPWFELMRPTERKKRVFEDVYRDVLSEAALDLVSQIFRYDPAKRPTAEEILAHPYFVSEEPAPQQAVELENIQGDWHEFESKALRKEKDKEARRAEYQKDKEKRKAASSGAQSERETKRAKQDTDENPQPSAGPAEQ